MPWGSIAAALKRAVDAARPDAGLRDPLNIKRRIEMGFDVFLDALTCTAGPPPLLQQLPQVVCEVEQHADNQGVLELGQTNGGARTVADRFWPGCS